MKKIGLLLVFCVIGGNLQAALPEGVSGTFTLEHRTYLSPNTIDENSRNEADFSFLLNQKNIFEPIRTNWGMEIRNDFPDHHRSSIRLQETYLSVPLMPFEFRVGYITYHWGTADEYNPTNYLAPQDYRDLSNILNKPNPALETVFYFSGFSLMAVYVPYFFESDLPDARSRWLPKKVPNVWFPNEDITISYKIHDATFPGGPDNNAERQAIALKLKHESEGFNASTSFYHGIDRSPALELQPNFVTLVLNVRPVYYRVTALGLDFQGTISDFEIRGEAAFFYTGRVGRENPAIPQNYISGILGASYTFQSIISDHDLMLEVQLVRESNRRITQSIFGSATEVVSFLRKDLHTTVEYRFGEDHTAKFKTRFNFIYNMENFNKVYNPELEYKLQDGLKFTAGGMIISGERSTLGDLLNYDERVYLATKYFF